MKPSTKDEIKQVLNREIPYLKEKYGVERIAIFGSYAKGNPKKRSDIDILVQLSKPLGFAFVELADYIETVLGKKVDISTFDILEKSKENPRYQHIALDIERTMIYV